MASKKVKTNFLDFPAFGLDYEIEFFDTSEWSLLLSVCGATALRYASLYEFCSSEKLNFDPKVTYDDTI